MENFSNTTVAKATFEKRFNIVKDVIKNAYNHASALNDEIQKEIETKQSQIESVNAQIKEISITQEEIKRFMSNLEKFIKLEQD